MGSAGRWPAREPRGSGTREAGGGRALRADALRNRTKLLEAAQEVFAASGLSASIDEIARTAGVGVGTVYRHFPTKEAIFEAIVVERFQSLVAEAERMIAGGEPGEAFFQHLLRMVRAGRDKRDFVDALTARGVNVKNLLTEAARRYWRIVGTLLANAQRAGAVRGDIGIEEVRALLTGLVRSVDLTSERDVEVQERLLSVVFDGLKARTGEATASGGG